MSEGHIGYIVGGDAARTGEDMKLDLLNPSLRLTRRDAAALNGLADSQALTIAAVGAGALGSQVAMNLARSGFGTWTVIDDDRMLPHNGARHALSGNFIGHAKAEALAFSANSLIDGEKLFTPVVADALEPGEKAAEVATALDEASVILDMSASVTVARHLALRPGCTARRVSLFLTPTGEDLVLLAEDHERSIPLDLLEMQYYRAIAVDGRLEGHFRPRDQRRRYGQSCRDITSDLPQELVALHAAVGCRAVRSTVGSTEARITIWRSAPDGSIRRVDVSPAPTVRHRAGEWTVCIVAALVEEIASLRKAKLPSETGGVLLGSFDLENRILYIVHTIRSPPDSEEWPTLYIRGCKGLRRKVEDVGRMTDGMLEYVGEWHSHPPGCPTHPSDDDVQVFGWLTGLMGSDGLPALMMIAGDAGQVSCHVGQMTRVESLLPRPGSPEERTGSGAPGGA